MSSIPHSSPAARAGWRLEHSYSLLPDIFYRRVRPVPVAAPRLAVVNRPLATSLGLDAEALAHDSSAGIFSGNDLPDGADPIAQAYAGHQFGHFTPLGDGRAVLLGEHVSPDGVRVDVQLKGSGETPFSRNGDGRAALGPMLREYIISEAMHALGIPTTRSLAVATTGQPVMRQQPLPGAVLTRIAASHIRTGTFEWAAASQNKVALQTLADYTRKRHDPELDSAANPHLAFLEAVIERQASLVARWMLVGFVHGVMNTDNMALSGETIDYGPCAFMEAYDPSTVFSSIDHGGRYAYGNQAQSAQWNLARLAEAMLPLFDPVEKRALDLATAAIHSFSDRFDRHWLAGMRAKLGLFNEEADDAALIDELLNLMKLERADHTHTFRALSARVPDRSPLLAPPAFGSWEEKWQSRLTRQAQSPTESLARRQAHNPVVIPRNHKVEEALAAATSHGDYSVMNKLLQVVTRPYANSLDAAPPAEFTEATAPGSCAYRTFCGT